MLPLTLKACLLVVSMLSSERVTQAAQDSTAVRILVDDFEHYIADELPSDWKFLRRRKLRTLKAEYMNEREDFYVAEEGRNKFLRLYTEGEAQRITMGNEDEGFQWNTRTHPSLQWDWRALQLPEGAREDKGDLNDTGIALYVTFSTDIFGRPKSIKYTYSSTLPVGTVVSYGRLKVLVVSSGLDGMGEWKTITRNILDDYKNVFGGRAPKKPLSITLWSDSDNTDGIAEADFDNIAFLPDEDAASSG